MMMAHSSSTRTPPKWFAQLRQEAESKWMSLPLPNKKDENYRATRLSDVSIKDRVQKSTAQNTSTPIASLDENEGALLIHSSSESKTTTLGHSPSITDFSSALATQNPILEKYSSLPPSLNEDIFALQNLARAQNGIFVHFKANQKEPKPLRGVHFFDPASESFFYKTLLVAEPGSEVIYIDELCGNAGSDSTKTLYANGLSQIIALPGSKVTYIFVENWTRNTQHFHRHSLIAHKDAQIEFISLNAGGLKGQVRTEAHCIESGALIKITGAARVEHKQHLDFWVTSRHTAPHTHSQMDYWTIAADQARSVFNGNIIISQEAVKSEAYQKNKNLTLSSQAEIDTYPKLEIATDDIKCAHGATVSSIDEEQKFYLESRGIPSLEAETLIVNGFTHPVISKLPYQNLHTRVSKLFERGTPA